MNTNLDIDEIELCKRDPIYFISKYIRLADGSPLKLNKVQKAFIKWMYENSLHS